MTIALLGVDIGTTNIKTVAFSPEGHQLAKATTPTPTHYPLPGHAEYHPEVLWNSLLGTIRDAVGQLPKGTEPTSIAFTGMAEAAFPLDKNDQPTYAAISWLDQRVIPQMQDWQSRIGAKETAKITGLPIATSAGVLRLLWLRDNEPALFSQTSKWLNLPDYAAFRLCGEKATEYSLASRMMILDLERKQWARELLDRVDLDTALFAQPVPSSLQIGMVHREAAELTGLPEGLPVCTAGHDHLCAAVGLGVTEPGDLFDSIGTAEAIVAGLPGRNPDPAIAESGIAQGLHILPERYYAITGNSFGGGSLDWARQVLLSNVTDSSESFQTMIEMAGTAPTGSGGVFFLPHLRQANPPIHDPASRAAFVGLSSDNGPGHMARAVFEGLAFEYQRIQDAVSGHFGLANRRLVAAGGGTRNSLFMQIKANVSGLPIVIPEIEEATCLGAAMAAGIGAGVYEDFSNALAQVNPPQLVLEPDPAAHDVYRHLYEEIYLTLYDSLKTVNHAISRHIETDE